MRRLAGPTLQMKKHSNHGTEPLQGIRVLVGRARHQAGALSAELRKRGAKVLEIPFIEIRKPRSYRPLDSVLQNLDSYDWLILTSVNGVEAMWNRLQKLRSTGKIGHRSSGRTGKKKPPLVSLRTGRLRVAAIGPATKKALEQRGMKVDVVPKEYVAESVVRSLKGKVKGKRVLLIRARIARDVIPRDLRKAGAQVEVVEAYETVVPRSSRSRLQSTLRLPTKRPHVVTFTSSSTVRNFVALLNPTAKSANVASKMDTRLEGIRLASIGPVTSATLREFGLRVDIAAREFTIPGLVTAIASSFEGTNT